MSLEEADRESALYALATRLQFRVTKDAGRFSLVRTADVARPVRESNLTLTEAEKLLETWKLRGPHGG
jgi:hypothetical protein